MGLDLIWRDGCADGPKGSWFAVMCGDATAGGKMWCATGKRPDGTWFSGATPASGIPAVVAADEADAKERCRRWAMECLDA